MSNWTNGHREIDVIQRNPLRVGLGGLRFYCLSVETCDFRQNQILRGIQRSEAIEAVEPSQGVLLGKGPLSTPCPALLVAPGFAQDFVNETPFVLLEQSFGIG